MTIAHHYRKHRIHQMDIANSGGGMLTTFPDGFRSELSYASAPYGEHALSAFAAAKRHVFFVKRQSTEMAARKKRSRAARLGWKTRQLAS